MFERSCITPGPCAAGFRSTRRTKIICTIGPTSCSEEMLETLAVNGMNVARLNMCHGSREWHHEIIERIRRLNKDKGCARQAHGSAHSLVRCHAPLLTRACTGMCHHELANSLQLRSACTGVCHREPVNSLQLRSACTGVCHHEPVNSLQLCSAHKDAPVRFSVAIMLDTEGSEVHTSALEQPIKAEARRAAARYCAACFDGHAVQPAARSKPRLPLPPWAVGSPQKLAALRCARFPVVTTRACSLQPAARRCAFPPQAGRRVSLHDTHAAHVSSQSWLTHA